MKIKQLREILENEGGQLSLAHNVSVTYGGDDVDVHAIGVMIAWINKTNDGEKEVAEGISLSSDAIGHIGALGSFAQYVGIPVEGIEPITIEKQVVVPDVKMSADLSRVQSDHQRSENEMGAEKRAYQWVVSELADKLRG